ncbi:MAG: hypothetical protein HQK91_12345 [Nitrospirae bacterium]|nr:hypothetical protein [Nitrospirota bacterium]MBF0542226.1 hypothetical protein [Nitrospirota bacterium]
MMQYDRFTKACLLAIVLLLMIILVKPMFEPKDSFAAAKKVQYEVIQKEWDKDEFQIVLNKMANSGWELVSFTMRMKDNNPVMVGIFKK